MISSDERTDFSFPFRLFRSDDDFLVSMETSLGFLRKLKFAESNLIFFKFF